MLTNTERQAIVEEVNAGTYGIDEALDDIAAAQKGEEVRKALYAEALVLNREGHAGSTDMIARQQIANLQTSVNGQISTLRSEVGDDIDDLETAFNSGLATQNGKIAAQDATIANVVKNYNVEYGSTELWASTGETGALAAGTTVTLSEDVSHFDYIDIYSFCGNSNVLDTVPVDAKLQSSQGYALRWVNLSDPGSGTYQAYVRIVETKIKIIGTTLTIVHQVTYSNGASVSISGAEVTSSNRSTYIGEFGIMKIVGRKITANTEVEDIRTGADGTEYASAGAAVRTQVSELKNTLSDSTSYIRETNIDSNGYIATNVGIGNAVTYSRTSSSNWDNIIVSCKEGESFTITGVGGSTPRLWAFVDSSNNLLSVSNAGASENNKVIIAPIQAAKLIANFDKSQVSDYSLYRGENLPNKINNKLVEESYYNTIYYVQNRSYDSDVSYVNVPVDSEDSGIIQFYVDVDTALSPMEYAQKNGTNVTINCGLNILTTGGTYTQGNIIGNGKVLNHNDLNSSNLVPNSVGYLAIKDDRSVVSFPISTTLAELQAQGVTNCFTYYYPLILNGTVQNFNTITANEDGVVLNRHPRMAVGVKSDKTIILFACDGRTSINKGMPSNAVANVLKDLGCNNAWMLDGGGSTSLTYRGEKLNRNDDGDGTVDRLITVKLNVKKPSALPSITDIYGQIGAEKQRTIKQIMPLFKSAESELNEILSLIGLEKMHFGYGYIYMNGSTADVNNISESASYLHSVSNCSAGDVYIVTGKGTYAARVWAFLDASGNVLSKSESDKEYSKETVVAPANASKFVAQASVSYPYFAYKKTTGVI